jgi:hypothetical protein
MYLPVITINFYLTLTRCIGHSNITPIPFQSEGKKMTVYSKHSYEDQDGGRILKAASKQQYIMFPAPIAFLNNELKAELGMKSKKEEEEDDAKFC